MEPWQRWREPLAVVLLVTSLLLLALRGVTLWLANTSGSVGFLGAIPFGDDLLLLATAGAVLWCATPAAGEGRPAPSPHAWPIVLTGLVVVGLTVLGWLALAVMNFGMVLSRPGTDAWFVLSAVEGLLRLVIPVIALLAVLASVRRVAAARATGATRAAPTDAADEAPDDDQEAGEPSIPARLPAAWQADEATGAVWLTADDAAQGRPGLSWSDPDPTGRDEPADRQELVGQQELSGQEKLADREKLAGPEFVRTADRAPAVEAPGPAVRPTTEDDDLR